MPDFGSIYCPIEPRLLYSLICRDFFQVTESFQTFKLRSREKKENFQLFFEFTTFRKCRADVDVQFGRLDTVNLFSKTGISQPHDSSRGPLCFLSPSIDVFTNQEKRRFAWISFRLLSKNSFFHGKMVKILPRFVLLLLDRACMQWDSNQNQLSNRKKSL